ITLTVYNNGETPINVTTLTDNHTQYLEILRTINVTGPSGQINYTVTSNTSTNYTISITPTILNKSENITWIIEAVIGKNATNDLNNAGKDAGIACYIPLTPNATQQCTIPISKTIPVDEPEFKIEKIDKTGKSQYYMGDNLTYQISVYVTKPSTNPKPVLNVYINDTLPEQFIYINNSAICGGNPCTPIINGRNIIFGPFNITQNQSNKFTIEFNVTINASSSVRAISTNYASGFGEDFAGN
ncbi:MAG: hypothetical protein ACK4YO_03930, partial [Candidatus Altarchaeaceae archaeon]